MESSTLPLVLGGVYSFKLDCKQLKNNGPYYYQVIERANDPETLEEKRARTAAQYNGQSGFQDTNLPKKRKVNSMLDERNMKFERFHQCFIQKFEVSVYISKFRDGNFVDRSKLFTLSLLGVLTIITIYQGCSNPNRSKIKPQTNPKKSKTAKNRIFLDVFGCCFGKTAMIGLDFGLPFQNRTERKSKFLYLFIILLVLYIA